MRSENDPARPGDAAPTRARVDDWLRRHGPSVMRQVTGRAGSDAPVTVRRITERARSAVVELSFEDRSVIAKLFDPAASDARQACEREAFALNALRGTGLAPELHVYAEAEAFLVMSAVPGRMLSARLDDSNLAAYARRLGAWSARYVLQQPVRELSVDWFDYLTLYHGMIDATVADEARRLLAGHPVKRFALAKHDMGLVNFIVTDESRMLGIDYETTRFKPVGWDVLTAAWALLSRFPGRGDDIVPALVKGWMEVGPPDSPDGFAALASFFARRAVRIDWPTVGDCQ